MISPHDEVSGTVVLANDCVPDCLSWPAHAHGQGKEAQCRHSAWVSRQQRLVHSDSGEMVDIAWLRQSDYGVDQHVRLARPGRSDGQFPMGSVHGIPEIVSNIHSTALTNLVWKATTLVHPSLLKCARSSAGESVTVNWARHPSRAGRTSQIHVIIVVQPVNRLDLPTNVVFLRLVEEVDYCGMLFVPSKHLFSLLLPFLC
jgi:hypothetical protein